jgi:transposase-like protein
MTHRRQFTAALNAQVVLELLSGAKSRAELCRAHQLAAAGLADWNAQLLARAASLFQSPDPHAPQDTTRIAALERWVGRVTLANALLTKATHLVHQHAPRRGR